MISRDPSDQPNSHPCPRRVSGWTIRLTALVVAIGCSAGAFIGGLAGCGAPAPSLPSAAAPTQSLALPPHLFRKWPKPDLALVLSGSMHGYLLPCGCSRPQVGGLERRYNFVQILRSKGWPLAAVDVGDVAQLRGPVNLPNVQGLIKYRYAMKALKEIGYAAVGVGEYEAAQPLFGTLGEWALNEDKPRVVVANLLDASKNFPEQTRSWELAKIAGTDLTLGVAGLVGPTVAEKIKDPLVRFGGSKAALDAVLKEMDDKKVEFRVLLYQGSQTKSSDVKKGFAAEAVECAKAFPQFHVILCLSEEDEPSSEPVWVPNAAAGHKTLVAALGHKGKYVGVVGVNRTGKADAPFELRYQLVELSETFLTPKDKENAHPIVRMMEDYTRELKNNNYLSRYGQTKHRLQVAVKDVVPTYVGSDKCKKCHASAYEVWKGTEVGKGRPHSHAWQTLADAKHPANRQYDAECIVCHTVGFGYEGGFTDAAKTAHLKDVGCESCHGPGSEHAAKPNDKQWQALMNEWRAPDDEDAAAKAKRHDRIDHFCQTCHDIDNDVTWKDNAFPRKWKQIAHPTVPE